MQPYYLKISIKRLLCLNVHYLNDAVKEMPHKRSTYSLQFKINQLVSPHFCKFNWKAYDMVLVKYFTFFCHAVGTIPFYCESNQFHNRSLYGTKINRSPKSSCLRFNNIRLVGLCLQTCMANVGIYYMLSYNKDQQACLCCTDFPGSEITDPSWETYEISKYKPIFKFLHFGDLVFRRRL